MSKYEKETWGHRPTWETPKYDPPTLIPYIPAIDREEQPACYNTQWSHQSTAEGMPF